MMKVVVFNGGLGNQMFQYAFFLHLKKRNPFDIFVFDISQSQNCHNGYELDRIFTIDSLKEARNYRRIERHCPKLLELFRTVKQNNSLEFVPQVILQRGLFTKYEGFWQSEKYFHEVEDAVRQSFIFNESLLNAPTLNLSKTMEVGDYVSVHIRRGDYVEQQTVFGLCSDEYYNQAISYIKGIVEHPIFVFFSDEIEWVRETFHDENAVYVDWNHGKESWQDMYLMTKCKHNIIANSSFSWWGAWLNQYTQKLVIAPKQWFPNRENCDIVPDNWIKL